MLMESMSGNQWWVKEEVSILLLQLSAKGNQAKWGFEEAELSSGRRSFSVMDWNLKAPCWDMTVVDEATTLPNIETMDESTRFGVYRTKGEFSVDLKLGQVGNSGPDSVVPKSKDDAAALHAGVSKVASSSPSGSYKRARGINNGTMTVSCLVDGCDSDLSTCRDYHRRHKVCEQHSKTPEVTIGGLKQRFCQQCSRFHSLEQFDEGKRSCRRRLDGHNRRRRKPQPETLTRPGSFLSSYQGTQLLSFSSPHVYSTTAVVSPAWSTGLVTSCADASLHNHNQHHQQVHNLVDKQDLFLGSSPSSYKEGNNKQFAFLHGDNPTLNNNQNLPLPAANSVCHALLRTSPLSETGVARSKMFCDSLANSVHDPPGALSLLSSSQTHTHGNDGLSQMVQQPHTMSLMQPLGLSLLHDHNSLESMDRVLVPNGSDHCSALYDNVGSDGSQGNEAPQLFPFQWE